MSVTLKWLPKALRMKSVLGSEVSVVALSFEGSWSQPPFSSPQPRCGSPHLLSLVVLQGELLLPGCIVTYLVPVARYLVSVFFPAIKTLSCSSRLYSLNTYYVPGLGIFVHIAFSMFWVNLCTTGSGML